MMEIFNKEDVARIKSRIKSNPDFVESVLKTTEDVRNKLYIQETGLATWGHYFVCPKCGVRLIFDYYTNDHFDCPNCSHRVSGEPYLGAWWNMILDRTSTAAFSLALLYVGTENREYFDIAKRILLGYADNYKNYEVHGDIPYNNPGRFASQVLSDAHPIYHLSRAYALLKDELTPAERDRVENGMLRPAAEHQIKYLTPQIHNHEVVICSSIVAIGVAIDDESLVKQALDMKYGIKYQLEHSYLEDGFWFEGSMGYHTFALNWFMCSEMMLKNTSFSLLDQPKYREKLLRAMTYLKNIYIGNNRTVNLNDGGNGLAGKECLYEYAYAKLGCEELLPFLRASYHPTPERRRLSDYALIYGVDELPADIPEIKKENYLSRVGSNLAMLRGSEDRYLLLKALPYGGEHDHYDRLAISFGAFGEEIADDFGTSAGYGSPLHYGYFKNTASHNTVVIDGENMAPCDTVVNEYRVDSPTDIYLDAETLPPEDYKMLDSFTIKQWSDEAYRGVRMRRVIRWLDKYFIDVFSVKSENDLRKEWTFHVNGKNVAPMGGRYAFSIFNKGAQKYITNTYREFGKGITKYEYSCESSAKVNVWALTEGLEMICSDGPGNPATQTVSYLLERSTEKCPTYVNVIEAYKGESVIEKVDASVKDGVAEVTVTEKCGKVNTLKIKL